MAKTKRPTKKTTRKTTTRKTTKASTKPRSSAAKRKTTTKQTTKASTKPRSATAKTKTTNKKSAAKSASTKPAAEITAVETPAGAPVEATLPQDERRGKAERRKVQRRRQIDPTTCERDYTGEEIEFMRAMDEYKRNSGRMFPTCSEILEVVRALGYVRQDATVSPEASSEFVGDSNNDATDTCNESGNESGNETDGGTSDINQDSESPSIAGVPAIAPEASVIEPSDPIA